MKATVSMELLWQTIQSLSLKHKEWLSSKLLEDIREEKEGDYIIRKSKFSPNSKRSVHFSSVHSKRNVQKRTCTQHEQQSPK